ncbi:MAG: NUDIX hydrolase [Clostridia bacterium]|nr:NUDIX hydrolase [Clostridia bacterium]
MNGSERKAPLFETTIDQDTIFNGRVFSVEVRQVRLSDGQQGRREIVRHHGGACTVALDQNGMVAMVRQFRSPFEELMLEIPAGKLEPGEDPAVCAERELKEETGLTADCLEPLAVMYPSPGYCSEILHIYLATGLHQGEAEPDPGELLHCERYRLADLLAMIDRGDIRDGKTVTALLTLDRRLRQTRPENGGV